ncbi:MAG: transcription elongation factor Spt5 [Candidatus Micrarchaeota archaeon]
MIFTARVTSGQEKIIVEILRKKAKEQEPNIHSIVYVDSVKGYLFIESPEENAVVRLVQKVKHIKGLLPKTMASEDIKGLVTSASKPAVTIEIKDIVEMISGPFKGEKAKVVKIDDAKDEITVELIEVAVPIPVSVKSKTVRLFRKSGEAE